MWAGIKQIDRYIVNDLSFYKRAKQLFGLEYLVDIDRKKTWDWFSYYFFY